MAHNASCPKAFEKVCLLVSRLSLRCWRKQQELTMRTSETAGIKVMVLR
ncbi:hypothetical protein TGAM01_v200784 [Trichoderma gamsii]|uniref:Uncharacterized protein n=1 Tax=Trichoderma gamsii TaxID=398673 RepID=A0A2P5A1D2_9HYPO|nr:hypothetical protein TGAM01_v200784 [Trichoderma gamsii]PON30344.1 hypothetical protein TGAM01_v200784 [Trichoderma gamsii]